MISLLWLIPALPFASALVLVLFGSRFSRTSSSGGGSGIDRTLSADHNSGGGELL